MIKYGHKLMDSILEKIIVLDNNQSPSSSSKPSSTKRVSIAYPRKACVLVHCGWIIISSLLASMKKDNIESTVFPSILSCWKLGLCKPTSKDLFKASSTKEKDGVVLDLFKLPSEFWIFVVISREAALSSLWTLIINHPSLCTVDFVRKNIFSFPSSSNAATSSSIGGMATLTGLFTLLPLGVLKASGGWFEGSVNDTGTNNMSNSRDGSYSDANFVADRNSFVKLAIYPRLETHILLLKKRLFQWYVFNSIYIIFIIVSKD